MNRMHSPFRIYQRNQFKSVAISFRTPFCESDSHFWFADQSDSHRSFDAFSFSFLLPVVWEKAACVCHYVSECVCVCVCVCMYTSCQEFIDLWWIILLWRLATFQYIHLCRHGETLLQAMMETSALVWLNAPTRWSQGTSSIFLIDGLLLRRGSRRSPTPPIRLPIRPSTYPPVCLAACNCYI